MNVTADLLPLLGVAPAMGRFFTPEVPGQSLAATLGVAALLAAVAMLACRLPARRATRVDPVVALRAE